LPEHRVRLSWQDYDRCRSCDCLQQRQQHRSIVSPCPREESSDRGLSQRLKSLSDATRARDRCTGSRSATSLPTCLEPRATPLFLERCSNRRNSSVLRHAIGRRADAPTCTSVHHERKPANGGIAGEGDSQRVAESVSGGRRGSDRMPIPTS
jgi:hypothetical protein